MTKREVLVRECTTIDRLATSAVTAGEVTALHHERGDDAVELRALVSELLAAGGTLALLTFVFCQETVCKWIIPVQSARKFSAVRGTTSAKSYSMMSKKSQRRKEQPTSIVTRPLGTDLMLTSKNSRGLAGFVAYVRLLAVGKVAALAPGRATETPRRMLLRWLMQSTGSAHAPTVFSVALPRTHGRLQPYSTQGYGTYPLRVRSHAKAILSRCTFAQVPHLR